MGIQTAERVSGEEASDNYVLQRSILAYHEAAKSISGKVLEIGTGSRYGLDVIVPHIDHLTTVDKFQMGMDLPKEITDKVDFVKMTVPPLSGLEDNSFDFAITFQVIEHIEDDHKFLEEIHRVLKPGGKLIVTTPNIKMSLTRNPWHVREYTWKELETLSKKYFRTVETMGVFGNKKVMDHYEENKASVKRITRFDIFDLQHKLPRRLLQVPYDVLNRLNRKRLYNDGKGSVSDIKMSDFTLQQADDECLDLYYVSTK